MSSVHGFPPISNHAAKILILGSMPGIASLRVKQYYAHPRNIFWQLMQVIFDVDANLTYAERCAQLLAHDVALWDVLKTCTRTGSLDSAIDESSIVPNDFHAFFVAHPNIRALYFNGAKAAATYAKHVRPNLPESFAAISTTKLPSTSPANASIAYKRKLDMWQTIRTR